MHLPNSQFVEIRMAQYRDDYDRQGATLRTIVNQERDVKNRLPIIGPSSKQPLAEAISVKKTGLLHLKP